MAKLTPKQERFIDEYLIDFNATRSAIAAGYSEKTANRIGAENLSKLVIQKEIEARKNELKQVSQVTQEQIIDEYKKIAFLNPQELFNADGSVKPINELSEDVARAISSIENQEQTYDGVKIGEIKKMKVWDKLKALDSLGKHLGIFNKDTSGINIGVTIIRDDI